MLTPQKLGLFRHSADYDVALCPEAHAFADVLLAPKHALSAIEARCGLNAGRDIRGGYMGENMIHTWRETERWVLNGAFHD